MFVCVYVGERGERKRERETRREIYEEKERESGREIIKDKYHKRNRENQYMMIFSTMKGLLK